MTKEWKKTSLWCKWCRIERCLNRWRLFQVCLTRKWFVPSRGTTECNRQKAVPLNSIKSCWSAGRTSPRSVPPLITYRASWRTSTRPQRASISSRHDTILLSHFFSFPLIFILNCKSNVYISVNAAYTLTFLWQHTVPMLALYFYLIQELMGKWTYIKGDNERFT